VKSIQYGNINKDVDIASLFA